MILRKCPNHGFEGIAEMSIFHNGLRSDTKMHLDAAVGGTMMAMDAGKAEKIIEAMTSTYYQSQNDSKNDPKKGIMDHNISKKHLAQIKILTQPLEALTTQMAKLPQQLQVVQAS